MARAALARAMAAKSACAMRKQAPLRASARLCVPLRASALSERAREALSPSRQPSTSTGRQGAFPSPDYAPVHRTRRLGKAPNRKTGRLFLQSGWKPTGLGMIC